MGKKLRLRAIEDYTATETPVLRLRPIEEDSVKKKDDTLSSQETSGNDSETASPQPSEPGKKSGEEQPTTEVVGLPNDPLGIGETIVRQLYTGFADQIPKALAQSSEIGISALQAANIEEYIKRNKSVDFQRYVRSKDPKFIGDGGIWDRAKGLLTPFNIDEFIPTYKEQFVRDNNLTEVQKRIEEKQPEIIQRRLDIEQFVEQQNKEAQQHMGPVPQSYKQVGSIKGGIQYAFNNVAQAAWQIPLVLATKGLSGVAQEAAEGYDQQLDQIVKMHNNASPSDQIDRQEAIKRNLDKPAEGHIYSLAAAGLDRFSAGGLLNLVKNGGAPLVKKLAAVATETLTEPTQGMFEKMSGVSGAGGDVVQAAIDAWTKDYSQRIDEAAGGFFGSAGPTIITKTNPTETIKDAIKEEPLSSEDINKKAQTIQSSIDEQQVQTPETKGAEEATDKPVVEPTVEPGVTEQPGTTEPGSTAVPEAKTQETLPVQEQEKGEEKVNNFTTPEVINRDYKNLKEKLGDKKAKKYFDQVDKLINPNTNEIVEYRQNGVVTKDGDQYTFHALADMDQKNWRVAFTRDITEQVDWKKAFDKETDPSKKTDILRAIADQQTSDKELNEIVDRSKGLPDESNILHSVEVNKNASEQTIEKVNKAKNDLEQRTSETIKKEESKSIVEQGSNLVKEANTIKEKYLTKKGTFRKGTPKEVIDRAQTIQNEYSSLREQFNKNLPELNLKELPFTARQAEVGKLQKEAETFFDEQTGNPKPDVNIENVQANYDRRVSIEQQDYEGGYMGQVESAIAETRLEDSIEKINNEFNGLNIRKKVPEDVTKTSNQNAQGIRENQKPVPQEGRLGKDSGEESRNDVQQNPPNSQGPPANGAQEAVQSEGEVNKKRKFTERVMASADIRNEVKEGISEEGRKYTPRSLTSLTQPEAQAVIENMGLDNALDLYLKDDTDLHGDVETALGIALTKELNDQKRFDDTIKVIDKLAIRGTELGQQVNAYKLLSLQSPEGLVHSVVKSRNKQKKQYVKENEWRGKSLEKDVAKETEKAVNKVIDKFKPKIESAVKKGSIKKAIDFLETLKIDNSNKPKIATAQLVPITPLFGLAVDTWNGVITVVQKGLQAGLTVSQAIQKAVKKINDPAFDAKGATAYLEDKLKDYNVVLDPKKAVSEELKQQNLQIENIVRSHYTDVDAVRKSLVDKLVNEAGIPKEQAKEIQDALAKEFDALTRAAKEKIINKKLPKVDKNKGVTVRKRQEVVDQLVEASNLGILRSSYYNDLIAEKLGVPELTKEQAEELHKLGESIQTAKGDTIKNRRAQDALNYMEKLKGWKWTDTAMSIYYANILSGPTTWLIVNPFANVTQFLAESLITSVKHPKNIPYIWTNVAKGFLRGALASADVLKTGYNPFKGMDFKTEGKPLLEQMRFKGGVFNPANYLKYVGRAIKAGDIVFYHPLSELRGSEIAIREARKNGRNSPTQKDFQKVYQGFDRDSFDHAMEEAENEGLKGREQRLRAYEILEQTRPEQTIKDANDFAARATFNSKPVGTLGGLATLLNMLRTRYKAANFLIPFVNTIINVSNEAMNYNPVFGGLRYIKGAYGFNKNYDTYRKLSEEERARIGIKALAGTVAMVALYMADDPDDPENEFEITANGYGDNQKNYELERYGWRPYSIRIGDTWMSYKNTPLIFVMAPLGFMKDAQRYSWGTDLSDKASILAIGSFKFMLEQNSMQALSQFFNIFGSRDINQYNSAFNEATRLAENTAKGFILPNAISQTSRLVQDVQDMPMKQAHSTIERFIRDMPILRDDLNNMYDAFGDPVTPKMIEKLTPLNLNEYEKDKDSDLFKLLKDNAITIGRPSKNTKKANGEDMTEEEYDKFALMAGQFTKQRLLEQMDILKIIKDREQLKDRISDIKTEARRRARLVLSHELE